MHLYILVYAVCRLLQMLLQDALDVKCSARKVDQI